MTKSELRKARKNAIANGLPLVGELALPRGNGQTKRNRKRAQRRKFLKSQGK